mmetsp:Transcript_137/g.1078  ORF Transcript_137/g.1078 Transcript_137/m.1078 type:complete len:89 (-) Transcript_137:34-300(-)
MSIACIEESFIFSSAIQLVQAGCLFIDQGAVAKEHLSFLAINAINFGALVLSKYTLGFTHHKTWDSIKHTTYEASVVMILFCQIRIEH